MASIIRWYQRIITKAVFLKKTKPTVTFILKFFQLSSRNVLKKRILHVYSELKIILQVRYVYFVADI